MNTTHIAGDQLQRFVASAFETCGVSPLRSAAAAEVLCYADTHGFESHGVINLERIYLPRLLDGRIDPGAEPVVVAESGATVVLDARNGLGLASAVEAIDLAVARARQFGVGAVVVRRSSHFGSAGYYSSRALAHNMIGIAMTNLGSQAIVRPPGGARNMLGTNPISMAAPAGSLPPFLLDMSTTVVATGKIRAAQRRGESIPPGWLEDDDGNQVTDPAAYDEGTGHLLLLGGRPETGSFKGYGLALMVDILCGVLAGASTGPNPAALSGRASDADANIGHFFLALNVDAFRSSAEFSLQMDEMLGSLLNCPSTAANRPVLYPGYLEHQRSGAAEGVPLAEPTCESLLRVARQLGLELPQTLAIT